MPVKSALTIAVAPKAPIPCPLSPFHLKPAEIRPESVKQESLAITVSYRKLLPGSYPNFIAVQGVTALSPSAAERTRHLRGGRQLADPCQPFRRVQNVSHLRIVCSHTSMEPLSGLRRPDRNQVPRTTSSFRFRCLSRRARWDRRKRTSELM